jgi:hypothetical protein
MIKEIQRLSTELGQRDRQINTLAKDNDDKLAEICKWQEIAGKLKQEIENLTTIN